MALTEEAGENHPRLQIYANGKEGCPMLARTLPQQRYDEKHPEKMADHKNDHWTIALAYFLISSGAMARRPLPTINPTKKWLRPKKTEQVRLGWDNIRGNT
jgi:hypothetical protein